MTSKQLKNFIQILDRCIERKNNEKATEIVVYRNGYEVDRFPTAIIASEFMNISTKSISKVITGENATAKGYMFKKVRIK